MTIDDYKKLFEIKHEEGWLDNNILFAKCTHCGAEMIEKENE